MWCSSEISKRCIRDTVSPVSDNTDVSEGCAEFFVVRGDLHRLWPLIIDTGPRVYMKLWRPGRTGWTVFVSPNGNSVNDPEKCWIRTLCESSKML